MEALAEQSLAPLYYRDNFLRLCETVTGQYGDLLTDEEHDLLARFAAASIPAQCLYIRLVSRTGPLFRVSKLHYPEIPDLQTALSELLDCALLYKEDALDIADLFALFTRPELETMFTQVLQRKPRPANKQALFEALSSEVISSQTLTDYRARIDPQPVVKPAGIEAVALFQVLFFGNRYQSLTQFVLEDLGVTRFYPYPLHPENRLFSCREALDEYLTCAGFSDIRYEALEAEDPKQLLALAEELGQHSIQFESSRPRWDKLCNRLGRDLERLQQWEQALAVYNLSQSYPARERSARILEKTGELNAARALCDQIISDPINEAENDAAHVIRPRLLHKLEGTPAKRRRDEFDTLTLDLARSESVEQHTAQHLREQWSAVHYVENKLMNALFGLAFWDVIFADEPGVFHHPFQGGPTDMYDPGFRRRRAAAITQRLSQLTTVDVNAELLDAYARFEGFDNHWVHWRAIDADLVNTATRVIPSAHLYAIWERMLFDPRENRRGFPDLIAFGETRGHYAMIEVKGPGDALQDGQKRWLRFFQQQEIPAQVAWVTWREEHDD